MIFQKGDMRIDSNECQWVQDRLTPLNSPGTGNTRVFSNEKVGQLNEKNAYWEFFRVTLNKAQLSAMEPELKDYALI